MLARTAPLTPKRIRLRSVSPVGLDDVRPSRVSIWVMPLDVKERRRFGVTQKREARAKSQVASPVARLSLVRDRQQRISISRIRATRQTGALPVT